MMIVEKKIPARLASLPRYSEGIDLSQHPAPTFSAA